MGFWVLLVLHACTHALIVQIEGAIRPVRGTLCRLLSALLLCYLTGLLFDFMWLILDEGWEANLDRQQRGITVAPIVAPGMRR